LIHFDLDDRYLDEQAVGSAISRREGVLLSITFHALLLVALVVGPTLPIFQASPEELRLMQEQERQRLERERQERTFVFVQPRVDLEARRPPERAELSDKDRMARAPERPPNPANPLPFARGNSTERLEESESARARGPESPVPPTPGEESQPESERRPLPPSESGLTLPREAPQARAGSGSLGEALRNLQRYVQNQTFDNPQGGVTQPGATIQFDTKGVEFGPWIRRFVAQVKRNWFIPYAAMSMRGHVVLQFNIHKDGRITDVAVVGASAVDSFNNAAYNAIITSSPTEPLPPEYPSDKAFFTVTFYYNEQPPA
jgi:TonB family protein